MSEVKPQTFNISSSAIPAGFPPKTRERLRLLGLGATVRRPDIIRVCGNKASADLFVQTAGRQGLLVPTAWGEYKIPGPNTIELLSRIGHASYRRFVAWALEIPKHETLGRPLFMAPRIWRDTRLNIESPVPVFGLDGLREEAPGTPPQLDAFYMDILDREEWSFSFDDKPVFDFEAPSATDAILLLRATLDPRWMEAATNIEETASEDDRRKVSETIMRLDPPSLAPRGHRSAALNFGPPLHHRIFGPPWYMEIIRQHQQRRWRTRLVGG